MVFCGAQSLRNCGTHPELTAASSVIFVFLPEPQQILPDDTERMWLSCKRDEQPQGSSRQIKVGGLFWLCTISGERRRESGNRDGLCDTEIPYKFTFTEPNFIQLKNLEMAWSHSRWDQLSSNPHPAGTAPAGHSNTQHYTAVWHPGLLSPSNSHYCF